MKPFIFTKRITTLAMLFVTTVLLLLCYLVFSSFASRKLADDFLKQLGMTKAGADEKIASSILDGYLDTYGVKNAKNIALGNQRALALDLLNYTKKQVNNASFINAYNELRNRHKPTESIAQTPEDMKNESIAMAKKGITDMEALVKKADASMKPAFEKALVDAQKNLQRVQDPNNKQFISYAKNYEGLVKTFKENYSFQLAEWEKKYPSNRMLYIKMRLLQFMDATKDIDFDATLSTKGGKKVFTNPMYERKDNRWKMAFRAGKNVVEPAREFVEKWIAEIN